MAMDGKPARNGSADSSARILLAELSAELRALRARSGKSLRELERATFASDSALSRYLSGRALPPWRVVEALCEHGDGDRRLLRTRWEAARDARHRRRASATPARTDGPADPVGPQDRLRAAHDLHHSLAHSIGVIKAQADLAVRLTRAREEEMLDALRTIQRASSEAIRKLDATIRVLSHDDRTAAERPAPR